MKTILCYGDSNTYGAMPFEPDGTLPRHDYANRWTTVFENTLNANSPHDIRVVTNAVNGRTIAHDCPMRGHVRNGLTHAPVAVVGNYPLDGIIIMLGTNDAMDMYGNTAQSITANMIQLTDCIRHHHGRANPCHETPNAQTGGNPVPIILVAPAPVADPRLGGFANPMPMPEIIAQLPSYYKRLAEHKGFGFVNAGDYIPTAGADGIHWNAPEHGAFGQGLADYVAEHWDI